MNCKEDRAVNNKYIEALMGVASDYDSTSQALFGLAHKLQDMPRYNPHGELYSIVRSAEKSTVELRSLAARTDWGNTAPLYDEIGDVMGISVIEEKQWIRITVPAILPKRNARDNTSYAVKPLRNSLSRFQQASPIERFERCVICIIHHYDESLGVRRVRDYDNIETKRYLDVIESFLLVNDSGLLCSVLQTTKISEKDYTEFFVMPPGTLPQWAGEFMKSDT